jgi:glycosyltransferase involved in cell wall biosynthesis
VPCEHNVQIFREAGVTVPIEVVHLGINPNKYQLVERPIRDTFTFLIAGALTSRKNPGMVINAFYDLFKNVKGVKLVIKTHSQSLGPIQFTDANIEVIDRYSTQDEMDKIFYEADAFVFPSRGEGFGLPPLEAMATGLPTIFSDNTGMSEFANHRYNYPIETSHMIKASAFPKEWGDVGYYYEPNYQDLKKAMWEVYSNREQAREKGRRASKWVHDLWTYERSANRIVSIIKRYF